jgi:glycosyltransferase involved in cell wall biosynthesis
MRVCMLVYAFYETDARVIRYAESLAARGDEVEVIALRGADQEPEGVVGRVKVLRIQDRPYTEKSVFSYLYRISRFLLKSALYLAKAHRRKPYDLIHVHNVPDFLVFAALFPKLRGARVILDIHDILPEFYAFKFRARTTGWLFRAMVMVERLSARFADHVVVSNHIWHDRLLTRSVTAAKSSVIINYPEKSLFDRCAPDDRKNERFVMLFPGSLNHQQGVDVAIRAFARIKDEVPQAEFHIYGDGNARKALQELADDLGLSGRIFFTGWVSTEQIAGIMAGADLGIEPKRDGLFAGEALSMKVLEFMAARVPVIVSATSVHRYYFNDSVVKFFNPEDEKGLAEKMLFLIKDKKERQRLVTGASEFLEDYT